MNTNQSNARGSGLIKLWHRFGIWRAKRIYSQMEREAERAERRFEKANELMRKHADPPQQRLPLGDD